ncbi:MAG: putative toxin-antitoxin system toxin component, PIN family [Pyrinomonadaceae bacterium]
MSRRKDRIAVVLDTNVIIGYFLSHHPQSAISRIFHLWRDQRKLQLIVSSEIFEEYIEILERTQIAENRVQRFKSRLEKRETVTHVQLGTRPTASRDADDNIFLATTISGKAKFLITNDRDLLDISANEKKQFKFEILSPADFVARFEE